MNVGDRVVDKNGHRGTLRFSGELPGAKDAWLGVEWDDVSRGKHDGSHNGQRYFTCKHGTAGSFVRAAAVNAGRSFVEVLRRRYIDEVDNKVEEMTLASGVAVSALGTGIDQAGAEDLCGVREAHLRGSEVSCCGDVDALMALKPDYIKLANLSNTLLSQWTDVAGIAECLPSLQKLELSDNRLELPAVPRGVAASLARVTCLHLNRSGIAWDEITCLSDMLPALAELHLCQNNITRLHSESSPVESPVAGFSALRLLNLELNSLADWSEVLRLRSLPKLERLILNNNSFTEVQRVPADCAQSTPFQCLQAISLNDNCISQWSSMDNLGTYSNLAELRVKDNPVFKGESVSDSRQLLIARVPQVKVLHSSEVMEKERQFAEQYYLKRYYAHFTQHGGRAEAPSAVSQAFVDDHRSYLRLLEIHGVPVGAVAAAPKSQILSLKILFPDMPEKSERTVSLPNSVPLQALKGMIRRLFRIASTRIRLTYVCKEGDVERSMDDDQRPLSYFALASGNTVLARVD